MSALVRLSERLADPLPLAAKKIPLDALIAQSRGPGGANRGAGRGGGGANSSVNLSENEADKKDACAC